MSNICVLCMENESDYKMNNCNHLIYCDNCLINNYHYLKEINKCPLCRSYGSVLMPLTLINNIKKNINDDMYEKPYQNIKIKYGKYKGYTLKQIKIKNINKKVFFCNGT